MATLVSICGGAEQAAYAIVWRPELLELESAASLRESLQARLKIGGFWWVDLQSTGGGNSYHEKIDRFKKHLLMKHLDARHPVYLHGFMHPCMVVQDVFLVRLIMLSIMMQSVEWKVTRASTAAKM